MEFIDDCCPICFGELQEGSKCKLLDCHHTFCEECVTSWVSETMDGPMCPLDKRTIRSIQYFDPESGLISKRNLFKIWKEIFSKWYKKDSFELFKSYRIIFPRVNDMDKLFNALEMNDQRLSEGRNQGCDEQSLKEFSDKRSALVEILKGSLKMESDPFDNDFECDFTSFLYTSESVGADRILSTISLTKALSDHFEDFKTFLFTNRYNCISHFHDTSTKDHLTNLSCGRQLLVKFSLLLKAAFLGIGVSSGMSMLYEESKGICLICANPLLKDNYVLLEFCYHSICIRCADTYRTDHPRCIFGCGEYEEGRADEMYEDNEVTLQDLRENEKDDLESCMKEYLLNLAKMSTEVIMKFKEHKVLIKELCKESANYKKLEKDLLDFCKEHIRFNLYTMFPLSYEIFKIKCRVSTIGCRRDGVVRFKEESMDACNDIYRGLYKSLRRLKIRLGFILYVISDRLRNFNNPKNYGDVISVKSFIAENQEKVRVALLDCADWMRDFLDLSLCGYEAERLQLIEAFEGYFEECPEDYGDE